MSSLSFEQVLALTGGRLGKHDAPCPLCGPLYNPKKKVLRIWYDVPDFAGWHCARCTEKGWVLERGSTKRPSDDHIRQLRQEARQRDEDEAARQLRKALWFWQASLPAGRTVETYLRSARNYTGPIPPTLRYLPPTRPGHHPAMIAAFGMASEPEPGVLAIDPEAITGIHLTLLKPDGSGKAGTDRDKTMVGRSTGSPIVIAPPNDSLGLAITEGIEDGLSIYQGSGLGVWAAGSGSRMPALAPAVPAYLDCISIAVDADDTGHTNATALGERLCDRGLYVELLTFSSSEEEAA